MGTKNTSKRSGRFAWKAIFLLVIFSVKRLLQHGAHAQVFYLSLHTLPPDSRISTRTSWFSSLVWWWYIEPKEIWKMKKHARPLNNNLQERKRGVKGLPFRWTHLERLYNETARNWLLLKQIVHLTSALVQYKSDNGGVYAIGLVLSFLTWLTLSISFTSREQNTSFQRTLDKTESW